MLVGCLVPKRALRSPPGYLVGAAVPELRHERQTCGLGDRHRECDGGAFADYEPSNLFVVPRRPESVQPTGGAVRRLGGSKQPETVVLAIAQHNQTVDGLREDELRMDEEAIVALRTPECVGASAASVKRLSPRMHDEPVSRKPHVARRRRYGPRRLCLERGARHS